MIFINYYVFKKVLDFNFWVLYVAISTDRPVGVPDSGSVKIFICPALVAQNTFFPPPIFPIREVFMPPIPELEAIRKAQILEAALNMIAENGCNNVTMADIATAAGLSKGGLTHYFPSKDELFKAVFTEFFRQIFERSRDTMMQFDDPVDQLLSFEWLYDRNDPDGITGYPVLFDFMSIAVHDPEYRAIFDDWVGNWVILLTEAIEAGIRCGLFFTADADALARAISAIYQGIATRWFLAPDQHSSQWAVRFYREAINGLLAPYKRN
jgi:AcrR family transcriptional regulator